MSIHSDMLPVYEDCFRLHLVKHPSAGSAKFQAADRAKCFSDTKKYVQSVKGSGERHADNAFSKKATTTKFSEEASMVVEEVLTKYTKMTPGSKKMIKNFIEIFAAGIPDIFSTKKIQDGFRRAGISPYDQQELYKQVDGMSYKEIQDILTPNIVAKLTDYAKEHGSKTLVSFLLYILFILF